MNFKQIKVVQKLLHLGIVGLVCLTSCVAENDIAEESVPEGENVRLGISTRSFNAGTDEQVNTVRIIQVARTISQSVKSNRFINNPADPLQVEGLTGNYDIYVIANENNDGSRLAALDNVGVLSELKEVVLPYDIDERPQTNIPMFGEVENVTIGLPDNGQPSASNLGTVKVGSVAMGNTLPVTLTRLAVRIDLTVKSKSFAALKSVEFTGLPNAIPLFSDRIISLAHNQVATVNGDAFANLTPPSTGYVSEKKKDAIILPSYLFLPTADIDQAASVKVSLDGKPMPFTAKIGHAALPSVVDKDYTLHPNTHYTLTALVAGDELTIETQVRNWDKNETDYPAGGGSFWKAQPQDTRIGLGESTIIYAEFGGNGTGSTFKWYRKKQLADFTFHIEEITTGITNTEYADYYRSELELRGDALDDACEVYCVANITAPDGHNDRLESDYATFMVMGDEVKPAGTYPSMQNWKVPQNVPLGSTCLLQDDRDNKVYRVKLMADDNWWMIQDLAYGNVQSTTEFVNNATNGSMKGMIGTNLYGVCVSSGVSTGGYLYNGFAAIQSDAPTQDDVDNNLAVEKEQLRSLCPEGWHLPGNLNKVYNSEWTILQNALKIVNAEILKGFTRFGYNVPLDFNAYNLKSFNSPPPFAIDAVSFRGGIWFASVNWTLSHGDLGFTSVQNLGAITNFYQPLPNNMGVPIRCLRNFK